MFLDSDWLLDILVYICTGLLQSCCGVCIELQPVLFLFASWTLAGAAEPVRDVIIVVYSAH